MRGGDPPFAEPWQAQAFALAVRLSAQGHFTWTEWSAALADELKAAADRGEPDDGTRYYEHWLAALERLVTAKGLASRAALLERKEAWADAYRHTPHGKPVELKAAGSRAGHRQCRRPIQGGTPCLLPAAPLPAASRVSLARQVAAGDDRLGARSRAWRTRKRRREVTTSGCRLGRPWAMTMTANLQCAWTWPLGSRPEFRVFCLTC